MERDEGGIGFFFFFLNGRRMKVCNDADGKRIEE